MRTPDPIKATIQKFSSAIDDLDQLMQSTPSHPASIREIQALR